MHRDLKPANIMIGRYGETLVVDWGLAKLSGEVPEGAAQEAVRSSATDDMDQTMAGSAKGTPSYMSPEQAGGRLGQIGPATDIYGLGATLYHVLTGRPPVDGEDTGEVLRKVERGEFPPPRSIDSGISRGLEAICLKAMALKPADRYQSARDLGGDLRRWLADEAISCYTDPPLKRLARLYRHHRRKANAAVLALVAPERRRGGLVPFPSLPARAGPPPGRALRRPRSRTRWLPTEWKTPSTSSRKP